MLRLFPRCALIASAVWMPRFAQERFEQLHFVGARGRILALRFCDRIVAPRVVSSHFADDHVEIVRGPRLRGYAGRSCGRPASELEVAPTVGAFFLWCGLAITGVGLAEFLQDESSSCAVPAGFRVARVLRRDWKRESSGKLFNLFPLSRLWFCSFCFCAHRF